MLCRTVCFFVILCGYANIVKSRIVIRNSISEIQVKFHTLHTENSQKLVPTLKDGKAKTKVKTMKREAAVIVNDDFDIPSDIHNPKNISETDGILDKDEGSGVDAFDEEESSQTTVLVTKIISEYQTDTTRTTVSTQSIIMEPVITTDEVSTSTDAESSGDGMLLFTKDYSTTEVTTARHTELETIPEICMNSTCSVNDLTVSTSEEKRVLAEGTNLTFSCKSNSSNHMLYWYKSNGSVHFLQAFGTEKELYFNVPDTKPIHSGKYICVRWVNKQTCCNLQSDLTVYEMPLYKYHLIFLGLIAAAGLIICIILSIRQSMAFKSYTKQFVEKHGGVKAQLL